MIERYPQPIGNFEKWYGDLMKQIEHASTASDIDEAVEMIRPYAESRWCFLHRLGDAEKLAVKSRARLRGRRGTEAAE